ncbi:DUF2628 domain-containing protein [Chryseobacterium sp. JUb7]|uniref:DUF2628 domain-containing protein n=1 Tax=Chryseobacterium sp. JUb7 TaxID=2940599 RepID=UPI00216961DD|nr:DUF2628 domain-containing protein [Chryseobacterium sp. JUb7]MCS3531453.1 hypothetical protein [Chryseobacterium sp. JUb7]
MKNNIELYETFFQERKDYYINKLSKFENNEKLTFNYATLIFGFFWFLYRKMYWEAIFIYSFILIETLFEKYYLLRIIGEDKTNAFSIIFTITFLICIGFSGNYLYLRKANRIVNKATDKYKETDQQTKFVLKKGGTSFVFIGIILALIVIIFILQ